MIDSIKIRKVKVNELLPYARNSRTHSEAQVAQIAASITEFGWTNPILADGDKGIIAGHGRLLAARKLGMDTVPVIELSHLTKAQKQAYIIADNKLALNAGWDDQLLILELTELKELDFDINLTGFNADELNTLLELEIILSGEEKESGHGKLSDRFMLPPFSVLNAREGWWQDRKRSWLALGIKSELGRGGGQHDRTIGIVQESGKVKGISAAPGGSWKSLRYQPTEPR